MTRPLPQPLIPIIACAWLIACVAPALAQDTRAGEIAGQQAEKNRQLTPNVPTGLERAIDRLESYLTNPNTVYFTFSSPYPSSSLAPGLAYRRAKGHARFSIGGAYSIRSYKLAHAAVRFPNLAGNRLAIDTRARWADATQVPFFGVGNGTGSNDRVHYGLRMFDAGGTVTFKPVSWYRMGATVGLQRFEDRGGAGARPSIGSAGAPAAPGLFGEARYTRLTVFTAIDLRHSPGYTRRGGLYSLAISDFGDADDHFSFRRIDAEVQQFLPVLREHWVLGFRALVQTTDADRNQTVPYYLLPSLGGSQRHRGYSDFRFQDRHLLLLTGEYRWVPSQVVDMALFVDAGKVARVRGDLDFTGLKTAWGIGLRVHGPHFTAVRIDVARGKEGVRLHLTGGLGF